jgi:ubiquinone/menaquinone biosynthesis C-methylase UbiE
MTNNVGIIKGKFASNYDNKTFSKKKYYKPNSFLNREIENNKILVDLCCGTGMSFVFLKDRCKKIYAVDASLDMINKCKERININELNKNNTKNKHFNNIVLINSDARNISLKDKSCDIVLIRMGLHHIKEKEEVIEESYRILKKKGKLIIMDHFKKYNLILTNFYDFFRNIKRGNNLFSHYYCSVEDLLNICSKKFKLKYRKDINIGFLIKSNIIFLKK